MTGGNDFIGRPIRSRADFRQSAPAHVSPLTSSPPPLLTPASSVKMPLHLLHHKSWHVYNTANVEKVERDKENARRKEEEEEMRMNAADQERRLQQLRGNAYGTEYKPLPSPSDPVERPSNAVPITKPQRQETRAGKNKHINFFEDAVTEPKVEGNKEREIEIAAEKKKWEDLVTSKLVNATKDHKPWYSQIDKVSALEKEKSEVEKELRQKKEMKWKQDADPLKQMERYLEKKQEAEEAEKRKLARMERELTERERRSKRPRTPEFDRHSRCSERRHHDEASERRHRRHRKRSRSPLESSKEREHRHRHRSRSPPTKSADAAIERLREERRKREAIENEKVQQLMHNKKDTKDRYRAVGHGGYSAQFHPEAVRR